MQPCYFPCVYLTEGAPVHVGAAHVKMLLVHHPQLGVQDATSQSLQVDLSDFCPWWQTKTNIKI